MKKILSAILISPFMLSAACAGDNDNTCQNLHVSILNSTKSPCTLTHTRVIYGTAITPVPLSIAAGETERFDMHQSVMGTAVRLSYQCGSENITFGSRQNLCLFDAGNISGKILHPMPVGITAAYNAQPGSYYWEKAGSISWVIEDAVGG